MVALAELPWNIFGEVGLVAAVVILILTGRLMPRTTVDTLLRDKDSQITDWRQAYRDRAGTMDALTSQNDRLLEQGETTLHLIQSIVATNNDKRL